MTVRKRFNKDDWKESPENQKGKQKSDLKTEKSESSTKEGEVDCVKCSCGMQFWKWLWMTSTFAFLAIV